MTEGKVQKQLSQMPYNDQNEVSVGAGNQDRCKGWAREVSLSGRSTLGVRFCLLGLHA